VLPIRTGGRLAVGCHSLVKLRVLADTPLQQSTRRGEVGLERSRRHQCEGKSLSASSVDLARHRAKSKADKPRLRCGLGTVDRHPRPRRVDRKKETRLVEAATAGRRPSPAERRPSWRLLHLKLQAVLAAPCGLQLVKWRRRPNCCRREVALESADWILGLRRLLRWCVSVPPAPQRPTCPPRDDDRRRAAGGAPSNQRLELSFRPISTSAREPRRRHHDGLRVQWTALTVDRTVAATMVPQGQL